MGFLYSFQVSEFLPLLKFTLLYFANRQTHNLSNFLVSNNTKIKRKKILIPVHLLIFLTIRVFSWMMSVIAEIAVGCDIVVKENKAVSINGQHHQMVITGQRDPGTYTEEDTSHHQHSTIHINPTRVQISGNGFRNAMKSH